MKTLLLFILLSVSAAAQSRLDVIVTFNTTARATSAITALDGFVPASDRDTNNSNLISAWRLSSNTIAATYVFNSWTKATNAYTRIKTNAWTGITAATVQLHYCPTSTPAAWAGCGNDSRSTNRFFILP